MLFNWISCFSYFIILLVKPVDELKDIQIYDFISFIRRIFHHTVCLLCSGKQICTWASRRASLQLVYFTCSSVSVASSLSYDTCTKQLPLMNLSYKAVSCFCRKLFVIISLTGYFNEEKIIQMNSFFFVCLQTNFIFGYWHFSSSAFWSFFYFPLPELSSVYHLPVLGSQESR